MFLLFTTDNDSFEGCEGGILECLHVDLGFLALYLEELGAGAGMSGREDGAAVLIGEDGGFEGVDVAGNADDLLFVHADQRTENGAFDDAVGDTESLHGLACDLTEAFSRDEGIAFVFLCGAFREAHHEAAEQESEVVLLTAVAQDLLDLRNRDDVYVDLAREFCELFREGEDLFLCALAGVGEAFEMHGIETDTALSDHKAGDGAVDAAGEQQKSLAVGADGHAADCLFLACADICGVIADFHAHGDLGMVNVDALFAVGFLQNDGADLGGDFGRCERKFLVGALCFYLEGAHVLDIGHELRFNGIQDSIHVFFRFDRTVDRGNAEGVFGNAISAVDVCELIERLDVEGALYGIDLEFSVGGGSALEDVAQKLFEIRAVCSLEGDLAVFAKNDLFHYVILSDR